MLTTQVYQAIASKVGIESWTSTRAIIFVSLFVWLHPILGCGKQNLASGMWDLVP